MSDPTSLKVAPGLPAVLAGVLVAVAVTVGATWSGATVRLATAALIAVLVAGWITSVHPRVVIVAFAVVLSATPYLKLPATTIPLLLVLCVAVWVALIFLEDTHARVGVPEFLLVGFVAVAGLSVLATSPSKDALLEYVAWVAATSVLVPIRLLPPPERRVLIATFVAGCSVASVIGILLLIADPFGTMLSRLTFLGYRLVGGNAQYVPGAEANSLRLTGTYVEPNIAGLVLAVGLLAAVAWCRGWLRVLAVVAIGAGVTMTLSRSAIATVALAALLVALTGPARRRVALLGVGALAAVAGLATPVVRERLLSSFGPNDTGSLARRLAFEEFWTSLDGRWWWGLGWDREEFRSVAVGRALNFVANAPLLTIYRGGAVLGAVAVVILLCLVIRSLTQLGRGFEAAVFAAGVIGFCLVALQLDFPVVIQHPAIAVFSLLIGLSLGAPPDAEGTP